MAKQRWGSKLGIIMAVAGSAIGLGNFLRFPTLAAQDGGGAFMIPYFIALFLVGLPLMWIEWTIGRFGGGLGHSTAPGMFHTMAEKSRFIKYFGVIGIFGPIIIFIYYTYVESWLLGYSFFAVSGKYAACTDTASLKAFLSGYQGLEQNQYFSGLTTAYVFFVVTFLINIFILYKGIKGGIEKVCMYGLPLLFILAFILLIRVFTLGVPDPARPENNVINGLGFIWNPKWDALLNPNVWLDAAGQIFFTLSVGIGVILTYASYLKKDDDVALSGLSSAATNEFAEVIFGGSIVLVSAFVFLGAETTKEVANSGTFNLGMVTMPMIFQKMHFPAFWGLSWFLLLFIAGITSSISLAQPAIALLEDDFNLSRKKAISIFAIITFTLCHAPILFLKNGVLDEMDFWGGRFCLVLFGTIEVILFAWVFGMNKAWTELHHGSDITIPRFYQFIIKYITPAFLLIILGSWIYKNIGEAVLMTNVAKDDKVYIMATRIGLILFFVILACLVRYALKKRASIERSQR